MWAWRGPGNGSLHIAGRGGIEKLCVRIQFVGASRYVGAHAEEKVSKVQPPLVEARARWQWQCSSSKRPNCGIWPGRKICRTFHCIFDEDDAERRVCLDLHWQGGSPPSVHRPSSVRRLWESGRRCVRSDRVHEGVGDAGDYKEM